MNDKNLDLELELEKTYRIVQFDQSEWSKTYVDKNIELRRETEDDADRTEKNFFKLMNSSVYGKKMTKLRKARGQDC